MEKQYYSADEILNNPEVVELAATLGFDWKAADTMDIRKRMKLLWDYYQYKGQDEGLVVFAQRLISTLGVKAGIHPLDSMYSYILGQKLILHEDIGGEPEETESISEKKFGKKQTYKEKSYSNPFKGSHKEVMQEPGFELKLRWKRKGIKKTITDLISLKERYTKKEDNKKSNNPFA